MPKTRKQADHERTIRRAGIRRGMRIALYEVGQMLAKSGVVLQVGSDFVPYTVDIAEGGRRAASRADRLAGLCAHVSGKSCTCHSTG